MSATSTANFQQGISSGKLASMIEQNSQLYPNQPIAGGEFATTDFSGILQTSQAGAHGQTLNMINRGGDPYLEIVEQPKARGLRFRYKCEGRSAGAILGEHSQNENRTYPMIQIHNFQGPSAIVVVSCVTKEDPPRPHPHSLVGKDCKEGVCTVKLKGSSTLSFPNLGIQCTTKKEVMTALTNREKIRVDPFGTGYFNNTSSVDLNVVRLAFQCFLPDKNGKYTKIVPPVVSQNIYDKKAVNDLVICRLSRQSGQAQGGDEVFMLTEKVNKDDIQIRFFEESPEGIKWSAYADFGQQDVHRQFAIVFRTPQYRNVHINQPVQVYIQLQRTSDGEVSEAKPFQYTPDDPDPDGIEKKRKRKMINYNNLMQDIGPVAIYPPLETVDESSFSPAAALQEKHDLKHRIKLKAQRNQERIRAEAAEGSPAPEIAMPPPQQYTSVADMGGQPTITTLPHTTLPASAASPAPMDIFKQITEGTITLQQMPPTGMSTNVMAPTAAAAAPHSHTNHTTSAGPLDVFKQITQGITPNDLTDNEINISRYMTDTGSLNINSLELPSFSVSEKALLNTGDLMQQGDQAGNQPMAAEEVVATEEVAAEVDVAPVMSINTQMQMEDTFKKLEGLN